MSLQHLFDIDSITLVHCGSEGPGREEAPNLADNSEKGNHVQLCQ